MVFGIEIGIDGKPVCLCCRQWLWHCKKCWNTHHNGMKHNDYIEPEYFGQPLSNTMEAIEKKVEKECGINPFPKTIIANKNKPYREGEYH